jgi:hypothetical protein
MVVTVVSIVVPDELVVETRVLLISGLGHTCP